MPDTDGYPNLHVAQHLPETMRDYGPPSGLTCFGFERLNKVVGDTNISNRNIERTFALSWWRADQLAMLPHVTGEWAAWSAAEKDLYLAMHGHATTLASDANAGGAEASIAEQVACDRSRAAPVMVHETAVFSEVVNHFYVRPRPLPAEVPAEVQARRAVMAHERERKKRARPARSSGLSLHLGPDDDDCDEGGDERAAQAAAPHVPGESKRSSAAPAPAAAVPLGSLPPRLRLTGAEPFVGRLVLPPAPEPRSRGLCGLPAEPRKLKPARHALDLDAAAAEDNAKRSAKKKADSSLHAELVSYFSRIYRCAHKTAAGVVVPPEPSHPQPRVPPGKDRAAWVAAWRAARDAAAPTEGQFAHFELSPVCPQSKRLQFFNQQIGIASSRLKKSSWVMVLSGTRICPARCLDFVEPTITLTRTDGTVLAPLTHRLVKLRSAVPNPSFPFLFPFSPAPLRSPLLASSPSRLPPSRSCLRGCVGMHVCVDRWFNSYHRYDEEPGTHSTGVRLDDDTDRLWWQGLRKGQALPPAWTPVQAIVSRFVYSPYTTASLVFVEVVDHRELRHRLRSHGSGQAATRARVYDIVFRPCALPVAMLL